jgi:hypothetical protein
MTAPAAPTAPSALTATVDAYLAAWTEPDAARRAALIERVWAADGRLIDPPLAAEGHAGIAGMAAALQAQFPGHRFRRSSGVDAHHDQLRFAWELVDPDGAVALAGLDVGEVDPSGRLRRVVGFFGPLPTGGRA